jgi:hypothetical protein
MSYYQDLLNVMGINFATEMVKQNLPKEVKMWRAVINNAIGDVALNLSDRKSSLLKMEAHHWIMDNTEDFQQVCYFAELEPDKRFRQKRVDENLEKSLSILDDLFQMLLINP